jgi:hypothetical protein
VVGDVLRRCGWIYANGSDKNQPTDFVKISWFGALLDNCLMIADFRFFNYEALASELNFLRDV